MASTQIFKAYVFSVLDGEPAPLGVVQFNQEHDSYAFAYAQSWLARSGAFPLDPFALPLIEKIFTSDVLPMVLADSLPDSWGQRVLQTLYKRVPQNGVEWLLATRGRGVGCLAFSGSRSGPLPSVEPPTLADIEAIAESISEIDAREVVHNPEVIKLLGPGSSMGGARPKSTLVDAGREWIAKFTAIGDTFDQVRAEAACLDMASAAGISVPEHRVVKVGAKPVLLVGRFDRDLRVPNAHFISAHALIGMRKARHSDLLGDLSYPGMAIRNRKFGAEPGDDAEELFRRMVFNLLIGNTDDHLRNHGFLYQSSTGWRLSPAFDLLPHPQQLSEHAIGLGTEGRQASVRNALSRAGDFGISAERANHILDEVGSIVADCRKYFDRSNLAPSDQDLLERVCRQHLDDLAAVPASVVSNR